MNEPIRTLVVGAGAVGGYFGGRMLEAGGDVTFLVRPRRAKELAESGLRIRSRLGDVTIANPPATLSENLAGPYDLVLLSSKAYDLAEAMESFAPAVGPETAILPVLNGMRHIDILAGRFGAGSVLGGQCVIAATLNEQHEIVHLNELHAISFGELDGTMSERVQAIDGSMAGVRFDHRVSANIVLEMWEKWAFLATLAGCTGLFRASVGDINSAPGGKDFMLALLEECCAIAAAAGYSPRDAFLERARGMLMTPDSPFTASMLRDIEAGGRIEADHIIGDLLVRDRKPLLSIVYTALKAYEHRRSRAAAAR